MKQQREDELKEKERRGKGTVTRAKQSCAVHLKSTGISQKILSYCDREIEQKESMGREALKIAQELLHDGTN